MKSHYYLIRVFDEDGKPLSTRCERAKGPRGACKLAFGVVYDGDNHNAVYKDLGGRKSAIGKESRIDTGWHKIPKTGD